MLSPNWTGLWGGDMATNNLPMPFYSPTATTNSQKIVILMTDGWNHFTPNNYTAYGYTWDAGSPTLLGTTDEPTQEAPLDARAKWVCDSLRFHGVTVYTIAFGVNDNDPTDPDSADYSLLQYCGHRCAAFLRRCDKCPVATGVRTIAATIANLRVSQ